MGLFSYTVAGGGFILIGAWESLISSSAALKNSSPSSTSQSLTEKQAQDSVFSSLITYVSILILSILFILNSLLSLFDALNSKDQIGSVLQLQVIAISLLFLLYSVLGLMTHLKKSYLLPSKILNMLCLFAFAEEFLLFYLQKKDPSGVENRYYDLLLVPITICAFCSILELKNPKLKYAKLGRGIGLILQGMWILQMGFSFFSDLIAQGCSLHEKSRGNYTVKCKGHPEYHRGRAIATLQFNCHLALLVTVIAFVYSIVCKKNGIGREHMRYRPIGVEMQHLEMDSQGHFTLDSDEDDDENGIKEERNEEMQKATVAVPESGTNGYHNHP
ncbi:uncharacterized protein [Nicotiana sylvestris]|uniref:Uncharacterized protein LOC104211408 n=1 Tax=Nicotiana sylvestris TaxID=4096 RepID=A0A1U7UX56_NICSY|nr:PREDICTED: uncharacterized protein LOC104211408 [Nicotiana sylvestris]